MANSRDFTGKNRKFTGTKSIIVPKGTTLQRSPTESGELRFNTTTNLMEYYDGTQWKPIDAPPTITSISPTNVINDSTLTQSFAISGTNFGSGAIIKFIGTDGSELTATTTTVNSGTSITAVFNKSAILNANEPYDVRIINASGLSGALDDQITIDSTPAWSTTAGSLGTVLEDVAISTITVSATDPDGDTIAYSVLSGTLPTGLSLNSSTGAITGTPNVNDTYASGGVTNSFTLRATAGALTTDRAFSILRKWADGSTQALAAQYGSEIITLLGGSFAAGKYWLTGQRASGLTAQEVYVDADGFMLYYRHAGTGGSYNATYEITGDALGEGAIGTLNSPTQGLTASGSSTTAGSRGVARLSTQFARALGGNSAAGNVYKITVGSQGPYYVTDTQTWYTQTAADGFALDPTVSYGSTYATRRNSTASPDSTRPFGLYPTVNLIMFYEGNGYSGGYDGNWHVASTYFVREY
jgi:hypothetical protein